MSQTDHAIAQQLLKGAGCQARIWILSGHTSDLVATIYTYPWEYGTLCKRRDLPDLLVHNFGEVTRQGESGEGQGCRCTNSSGTLLTILDLLAGNQLPHSLDASCEGALSSGRIVEGGFKILTGGPPLHLAYDLPILAPTLFQDLPACLAACLRSLCEERALRCAHHKGLCTVKLLLGC